jgi:hypothetical protein
MSLRATAQNNEDMTTSSGSNIQTPYQSLRFCDIGAKYVTMGWTTRMKQ